MAAYRGQWGHKPPGTWPIAEFAGSTVLGLRRAGLIAGICRIALRMPGGGAGNAPAGCDRQAPGLSATGIRSGHIATTRRFSPHIGQAGVCASQPGQQDGEADQQEQLVPGGEPGCLADGADSDGGRRPPGGSGFERRESQQGKAEVTEQRHSFQQTGRRGMAEPAGDGRRGGGHSVQTT